MSYGKSLKPQELSNTLLACAVCAHWDSHVYQLLASVLKGNLSGFSEQQLSNTLHSWAVLTCIAREAGAGQQQVQELGQVAGALFEEAGRRWEQHDGVFIGLDLCQLFQAHMYAEHLGLPQRLEGGLLKQAREAWLAQQAARSKTTSRSLQEVNSTLGQMGYKTQLQALTADGLLRLGITISGLPDGSSSSIGVGFRGAFHYVAEQMGSGSVVDRLDGPTRLSHVLLMARSPAALHYIPWREWDSAKEAGQQEEYLSKALAHALSLKDSGEFDAIKWSGSRRGAQHTTAQSQPSGVQGPTSDACQESHASSLPAVKDGSHGVNPDDIQADLRQLERAL
jgi:hypothetical protein